MLKFLASSFAVLIFLPGLAAGAPGPQQQLPPGHPPPASDVVPTPPPGSGTGAAALHWTRPESWQEETPSSFTRRAQYRVPGPGGDAQCVVYYFGPGQGGDTEANAQRWAGQFTLADGRPGTEGLKRETLQVAGLPPVLMVEVAGTYQGGMMTRAAPRPDSMLLGGIAQGSDANWFFKFTGPAATVKAQREAFRGLLLSLRPGQPAEGS